MEVENISKTLRSGASDKAERSSLGEERKLESHSVLAQCFQSCNTLR